MIDYEEIKEAVLETGEQKKEFYSAQKKSSLSFKIFGDTDAFQHMIDLRDASVVECIDSYCKNKRGGTRAAIRSYSQLKKHLMEIQQEDGIELKPIVVCDMFWNQFHAYLLSKGLAPNTVEHVSSKLHAVLEWAAKYGARVSPTLGNYHISSTSKAPYARPKISLTLDEVSRITYFDIDNLTQFRQQYRNTLKKVRDQFVLACFLGQRYSDVKRIDPDCFSSDVFTIVQQKTGNKAVVDIKKIAAYPSVVRHILERYNYSAPYPHEINGYNKHLHTLFRLAGFNEEVRHEYKCRGKIVQKTFKKWQLISSHTARRTMITNAVQRGLHNEEVRRASGHKSEAAFSNYLCWNNE